jgi:hypothetical protein
MNPARVYVGFRAPPALKSQLEAAARANGRSLSTEAQVRLERSFLGPPEWVTNEALASILESRGYRVERPL